MIEAVAEGRQRRATDEDRLSETFAVLANSTRRALLLKLREGEFNVNELAEPFNLTLPAISKHLKVLEQAGLIVRSQRGQYRPCELNAVPLHDAAVWIDQYRPDWEARLDQLGRYVNRLDHHQSEEVAND